MIFLPGFPVIPLSRLELGTELYKYVVQQIRQCGFLDALSVYLGVRPSLHW